MTTLRKLRGPLVTCVLLGASIASAQDAPKTPAQPSTQPCGPYVSPADCPTPTTTSSEPTPAPAPTPTTSMPPEPTSTTTTTTTTAPPITPPQTTTYTPTAYEPPAAGTYEERPWYETVGYGLSVGGGVDDFVGKDARATTKVGGGWDVRLTVGTRQWLALEASYIGSAQAIDALGLDSSAVLVGNGAQGAVRVNLVKTGYAQPFIYGGGAWRRYSVTNKSFNTSDVKNKDDVFELPVGIGIAGYVRGFMADLRGEYRGVWRNDLIPAPRGNDNTVVGPLDRWGITGNIGAEF